MPIWNSHFTDIILSSVSMYIWKKLQLIKNAIVNQPAQYVAHIIELACLIQTCMVATPAATNVFLGLLK